MSRTLAWLVHLYTASGVLFALLAVLETDVKRTFIWLTIAVLIDATDGALARRFHVKSVLPQIDGRKIDDIVDYLTFTFVPLLIVLRMEWVPEPAIAFVAPALMASLLGFANSGAKDEARGFFLGFPSYFNVAAFYFGIIAAQGGQIVNGIIILLLAVLTVTPIGFIYPNLAPRPWKWWIIGGGLVWLAMLMVMLPSYPHPPLWLFALSWIYPLFYVAVSIIEYRR